MKIIKNITAALIAFMFITTPASAQEATPGSMWWATAYCMTENAAMLLSRRVAEAGQQGYDEVMKTDRVFCWDSRLLNNVSVPYVEIIEKVWQVVTPLGQKLDFWTARDANGSIGWTWFIVSDLIHPA